MKKGGGDQNAKLVDLKLQPASSFSARYSTARSFSGGHSVYLVKVPASMVLGTYRTGFGCTSEHEVVVLANKNLEAVKIGAKNGPDLTTAMHHTTTTSQTWKKIDKLSKNSLWLPRGLPERLDADLADADWIKEAWDLPPYKSAAFFEAINLDNLDAFRRQPVYQHAVNAGLIYDDEWVADWVQDGTLARALRAAMLKYNPDQERDDHGRWTSGGGESSYGEVKYPVDALGKFQNIKDLHAAAKQVAKEMGYKGKIDAKQEHLFQLSGKTYRAAGGFNPMTKDLSLYQTGIRAASVPGVMAHEIQHAKNDLVIGASAFSASTFYAGANFTGSPSQAKREEEKESLGRLKQYLTPEYQQKLRDSDGCTDYSRQYWKEFEAGKRDVGRAHDETLAEVSKLYSTRGEEKTKEIVAKEWIDYHKAINTEYDRRTGKTPKMPEPKQTPPAPKAEPAKQPTELKPPAKTPEEKKEEQRQKRLEYRRERLKNMHPEKKAQRTQHRKELRAARKQKKLQEQQQ